MADWENIPRLDPALQDEIDNVQLKHNALVEAVRGYSGGSIAGKTNEVMDTHQDNLDTVATHEKTLISAIGQPEPSSSMLLDFVSQTYFTGVRDLEQAVDPHKYLDVSRATPKWVMGPQGKLVEVPPDTLAYEYDRVTGEPLGVLIEPSATNGAPNSSWYTWVQGTSVNGVTFYVDDSVEDPAGGRTAVRVVKTGTNSRLARSDWPSGKTRSIYARTVSGTGSVYLLVQNDYGTESVLFDLDETWRRYEIPLARHNQLHLVDFRGASTLEEVLIWGFQSEGSDRATSYIPTNGSPVTRAADNMSRELGAEFNGQEGTLFAEVYDPHTEGRASYFHTASSGAGDTFGLGRVGSDLRLSVHTFDPKMGTSKRFTSPAGAFAMALSYSVPLQSWSASVPGASTTFTPEAIFTPSTLRTVPRIGGAYGPGFHIKRLAYYPRAMSEQELQELTANG